MLIMVQMRPNLCREFLDGLFSKLKVQNKMLNAYIYLQKICLPIRFICGLSHIQSLVAVSGLK